MGQLRQRVETTGLAHSQYHVLPPMAAFGRGFGTILVWASQDVVNGSIKSRVLTHCANSLGPIKYRLNIWFLSKHDVNVKRCSDNIVPITACLLGQTHSVLPNYSHDSATARSAHSRDTVNKVKLNHGTATACSSYGSWTVYSHSMVKLRKWDSLQPQHGQVTGVGQFTATAWSSCKQLASVQPQHGQVKEVGQFTARAWSSYRQLASVQPQHGQVTYSAKPASEIDTGRTLSANILYTGFCYWLVFSLLKRSAMPGRERANK